MIKREFQMAVRQSDLDKIPLQLAVSLPYADWRAIQKALNDDTLNTWAPVNEHSRKIKELLDNLVRDLEPYAYTIEQEEGDQ